jgi:hypothetical protein
VAGNGSCDSCLPIEWGKGVSILCFGFYVILSEMLMCLFCIGGHKEPNSCQVLIEVILHTIMFLFPMIVLISHGGVFGGIRFP